MATSIAASVRPITAADTQRVAEFLHRHLNPGVSPARWRAVMTPPWPMSGPNRGQMLVTDAGQIVGAYLAVYSTRPEPERTVCNLAAFCVLEPYRPLALRLIRANLRARGTVFTDLSPSGTVPAMNERLGFAHLDVATRLVVNAPRPAAGYRVVSLPAEIEPVLSPVDAGLYRDHRDAAAARHLVVIAPAGGHGYLMYRRDRRKRLALFASPLYVGGDPEVLRAGWGAVAAHLLRRGLPMTLAERRVLGFTPPGPGRALAAPRPKMYRPAAADPNGIDYLYSELALLEW
ncbi:hypothetical protein [Cumulibacter manganitolerans]|uniref:hypothetical protein n=1 Tax=Cumulibacter manganitolerans TaxID=1884992 RepID=UPI0012963B61|nr:hypothetical protein [Cumulibacter manganitolerans]